MGAFFLVILFGKIADATHNFNHPLFLVGFVVCWRSLFWLIIDPTKQLAPE